MDPNETLRRIREIARKAEGGTWMWDTLEDAESEMLEALENFAELDRWLLSGGYLPAEWSHPAGKGPVSVESSGDPWLNPQVKLEPPF